MYTIGITNIISTVDASGNPRPAADIAADEAALLASTTTDVQAKVDAYSAAQAAQVANGGPGPVADFETMKICNEHSGAFQVVFA